jgi:hypothetical protein
MCLSSPNLLFDSLTQTKSEWFLYLLLYNTFWPILSVRELPRKKLTSSVKRTGYFQFYPQLKLDD